MDLIKEKFEVKVGVEENFLSSHVSGILEDKTHR